MRLASSFDVGIIGGGIMGASAAYHLSLAGLKVGVLERGVPGQQASGANAGTLSVQNKPLASVPAVLEALAMWASLTEEFGVHALYERRGGFRICHGADDLSVLERQVREQKEKGVPTELICGDDLRRELPYLAQDVVAASYCGLDGMANPFAAVNGFLSRAIGLGAHVWTACRVENIKARVAHPFVVHTSRGRIECRIVVAAAGAWNRVIAAMVGVDLPIRTLVQQALITTSFPDVFPHIITHVGGILTLKQQRMSGKIQIGGGWPGDGDPEMEKSSVRRSSLIQNLKVACATVPAISKAHLLRAWTGFEGRTPDKLLLAGPVGPEGFFVVGCQSGGFTISPLAGEIVADHILGRKPRLPVDLFLPNRFFSGGPKGTGDS